MWLTTGSSALSKDSNFALGKGSNFAECFPSGTRQNPRYHQLRPITVRPSRLLYVAEGDLAHGKALPSAREMALGKPFFAVGLNAVCCSPSATLGKVFAECILAFAECFRHSAKEHSPVVACVNINLAS